MYSKRLEKFNMEKLVHQIGYISIRLVLENRIYFTKNIQMFLKKFHSSVLENPTKFWSFSGPWVHISSILSEMSTQNHHLHPSNFCLNLLEKQQTLRFLNPSPSFPGRHVSAKKPSSGLICSNGIL